MRSAACCWLGTVWLGTAVAWVACANRPPAPAPTAPVAPPASSAAKEPPAPPPLSLVNASAVVNNCPDAKWMHTGAAQRAIQKLIDPCAGVPGGRANFLATLIPGGQVELASPSGDPDEGVVPTCVLKDQSLRHQVFLKHPCSFDVALEERPEKALPPPASSAAMPD